MPQIVQIDKLVHGGQGLGVLPDGRKIFVWNALPGEQVSVEITNNKKSYAEGISVDIIKASTERIEPKEKNYLSTSPWQIMDFATENHWKQLITQELFSQAGVKLPKFDIQSDNVEFQYRNKMEYSFWGDDDGLHLALYNRGSHQKQIVDGSALALPALDKGAKAVLKSIPSNTRAGDLKTLVVRCNQNGEVVAALYTKRQDFYKLELPKAVKGLKVYFSNPKSPASVRTKLLYEIGESSLEDKLLNKTFCYDVDSFFQVNIPVFEKALAFMKDFAHEDELVDMYAGVGSIGLSLAKKSVDLVEIDQATAAMAEVNAMASGLKASVTMVAAEKSLDYITNDKTIIFDPPRAGLHEDVTAKIMDILPPKILYLSCNPATQARDLAKLQLAYKIKHFKVFNFFPRTPHIESLAILEKS